MLRYLLLLATSFFLSAAPTTGTLHIQASAIIHQAQLQSLTGATLATYTPGTHQATISIAHLPPGIYTLRINHQYIFKVVKQ